ncbi:tetratricopeptide repeat protein, partial [Streptomyces sp. B1866]|uniref:ATP-binding protein n=1 Tax=Streptomyces sp. B1866 TaxID=3075431 RepID=UPI00288D09A1
MIDWSWELLTGDERAVLRRLAVYADGCALDAAEAVCAGDGVRPERVLDVLARLVDRSLVVAADGRYRLLESVAAYCAERLDEAGEAERTRRRHARYYTDLAAAAEEHLRGPGQQEWLRRLDAESANLRNALDGLVRRGAAGSALRLVTALVWYWFLRGRLGEARRALDLALGTRGSATGAAGGDAGPDLDMDAGPGPDLDRDADADAVAGLRATAAAWRVGVELLVFDGTGPVSAERIRAVCDAVPAPLARARARWFLGMVGSGFGDPSLSPELLAQALAAFRAHGDRWGTAAALAVRASQAVTADPAAAGRDGERSLALFRELDDRWGRAYAHMVLGTLAEITGDYARAAALHRDGLRTAEELRLWPEVAARLSLLGRLALLAGDHAAADAYHERARRLAAEQAHPRAEQFAEVGLGMAARRRGDLDAAERHLRGWLDWCRQWDGDPGTAFLLAELGFIAELRGDPATALALHREGLAAARAAGGPRAVALALEGLAGAYALGGDPARAARLL